MEMLRNAKASNTNTERERKKNQRSCQAIANSLLFFNLW